MHPHSLCPTTSNSLHYRIQADPEAIQTSFMIGTILHVLERDTDGSFHKISLAALPKFITYRIPDLRGDDPPYSILKIACHRP